MKESFKLFSFHWFCYNIFCKFVNSRRTIPFIILWVIFAGTFEQIFKNVGIKGATVIGVVTIFLAVIVLIYPFYSEKKLLKIVKTDTAYYAFTISWVIFFALDFWVNLRRGSSFTEGCNYTLFVYLLAGLVSSSVLWVPFMDDFTVWLKKELDNRKDYN